MLLIVGSPEPSRPRPSRGPRFEVIAYLDSSALLRLVLREQGALEDLRSGEALVSSGLLAVECAEAFPEAGLRKVFARVRETQNPGFPFSVFYALQWPRHGVAGADAVGARRPRPEQASQSCSGSGMNFVLVKKVLDTLEP